MPIEQRIPKEHVDANREESRRQQAARTAAGTPGTCFLVSCPNHNCVLSYNCGKSVIGHTWRSTFFLNIYTSPSLQMASLSIPAIDNSATDRKSDLARALADPALVNYHRDGNYSPKRNRKILKTGWLFPKKTRWIRKEFSLRSSHPINQRACRNSNFIITTAVTTTVSRKRTPDLLRYRDAEHIDSPSLSTTLINLSSGKLVHKDRLSISSSLRYCAHYGQWK